ncbi:hypothetical protein BX666DRAFT_669019 [Dichotomocladium elegans]|nr:hypothetical protein BX666DRAFT_669019 [Dichotomocladium elegans]
MRLRVMILTRKCLSISDVSLFLASSFRLLFTSNATISSDSFVFLIWVNALFFLSFFLEYLNWYFKAYTF